jgi:LacI family transcriptional regulator
MTAQEGRAVTLEDVAARAGVSLATASRVVNGSTRNVSEELRQRVNEAAIELNYSPNAAAQAVAKGRTNIIGLLVHEIADPYFSAIASGVMKAAESSHLLVTMASTGRDPDREAEHVAAFRSQRARAVIVAGSRLDDKAGLARLSSELRAFEGTGGRVAIISQDKLPMDTVILENKAGARDLASALVHLGHKRFAVLGGPPNLLSARDRVAGFRDGLARAGMPAGCVEVIHGEFDRDGGRTAMLELLDRTSDATCVFATNDMMALGALAALRDRGVSVPDDMALAGFGDLSPMRDVSPTLTTVRTPLADVGAAAVELVLSERKDKPRARRIRGEVVVRESTPAVGDEVHRSTD